MQSHNQANFLYFKKTNLKTFMKFFIFLLQKKTFLPGMERFDYILPKIKIIWDGLQKIKTKSQKYKSESHFHFA